MGLKVKQKAALQRPPSRVRFGLFSRHEGIQSEAVLLLTSANILSKDIDR
jgi:hypothetical protein